jgi:hypothetical protein
LRFAVVACGLSAKPALAAAASAIPFSSTASSD